VLIRGILTWLTANKSIALEAICTAAISCMVGVNANGIRGARIMDIARMLAELIYARFRDTTVRIVSAFNWKVVNHVIKEAKAKHL